MPNVNDGDLNAFLPDGTLSVSQAGFAIPAANVQDSEANKFENGTVRITS